MEFEVKVIWQIEVIDAKTSKNYGKVYVSADETIGELKSEIHQVFKTAPTPDRQSLRLAAKGEACKDSDSIQSLNLNRRDKIYIEDLGPEMSLKTILAGTAGFACAIIGCLLAYVDVPSLTEIASEMPVCC